LGDALLNFSRGAVRPEVELVLRPSLKTEDILNIPPHVSTRAYVDVCLMSMGFVDLMGSKEEQIIERKAYLVDVIASSSKTMQEMEYKKLVALTTVIDRYEKEDKFYGAIITYQAGDRELKFENHMAQQGFMGMSHVTRAQKILATPAKIDEAQNKKQFIVEVLDLFTNLLNKFKQELSALLTVINSRNKYDELFNGEYADVEWPPEDYSELTKEDDSQSSDSDKENEPGTIVRHATQEKSTVVLHSNPENPKAAPPPWASDRPLPLLQLRN